MRPKVLDHHDKKEPTPSHKSSRRVREADLRDRGTSGRPRRIPLDPFTGVCLKSKYQRDGLSLCVMENVAVYSWVVCALLKHTHAQGHIRSWPDCSSREETQLVTKCATLCDPKAISPHNPQGRRQEQLSDARDFRVGTQTMHSLLAVVCTRTPQANVVCRALPRRRACAARAFCMFWTGTHRVAA